MDEKKSNWRPVDLIVAIITVTICSAVLGTLFIESKREDVQEGHAKNFIALLSALISIVSMFVGAKIQEGRRK